MCLDPTHVPSIRPFFKAQLVSDTRVGNLNLNPECKTALDASVAEKYWWELREKNEKETGGVDS